MTPKKTNESVKTMEHLSVLLRKLADLIDNSPEKEINALVDHDNWELRISRGSRKRRLEAPASYKSKQAKQIHQRSPLFDKSLPNFIEKLRACETRDEGRKLLFEQTPTKAWIEGLARFLDLPVHRSDTIQILSEKVIESVIGSRLRSEAVQGKKRIISA